MQLVEQYREVARRDKRLKIFGASQHRYKPVRVSEAEVAEFEGWIGCPLPEDYRQFLVEVGTGVGPYYGLWGFKAIRDELAEIYEDYKEEHKMSARPGDAFELQDSFFAWRSPADKDVGPFDAPKNPGGFLPIGHQGCEYLTVMVTSGLLRGKIFGTNNFAMAGSQWISANRPPGIVPAPQRASVLPGLPPMPSFSEWFLGWTEHALHHLGT